MAQQREGQETFLIQAMLIWIWYCVNRPCLCRVQGAKALLLPTLTAFPGVK